MLKAAQYRAQGNVLPSSKCPPLADPSGVPAKENCRPDDAYRVMPRDIDYCLMTHVIYAHANPKASPPPEAGGGNPYGGTGPEGYHTKEKGYVPPMYSHQDCTPDPNPRGQDWGVCFQAYEVAPTEWNDIRLYKEMRESIAAQGSGAKMVLSIGGWSFGTHTLSEMAQNKQTRQLFVDSSLKLAADHGFEGINLDWQYPGTTARIDKSEGLDPDGNPKYGGRSHSMKQAALDKPNFCSLLSEFREKIKLGYHGVGLDFSLSVQASVNPTVASNSYDFKCMSEKLDWIGVETRLFHGSWDAFAGGSTTMHDNTPNCCALQLPCCVGTKDFYGAGYDGYWGADGYMDDGFSIVKGMELWETGLGGKDKLVVGLSMQGSTQKLTTPNKNLGARTKGAGWEGAYTLEAGFLSYFEILGAFPKNTWHYDDRGHFLWASDCKDVFVSFDDECTLTYKTTWAKQQGYRGVQVFDIGSDQPLSSEFPLLNAVRDAMIGAPRDIKSCARDGGTLAPSYQNVAPLVCNNTALKADGALCTADTETECASGACGAMLPDGRTVCWAPRVPRGPGATCYEQPPWRGAETWCRGGLDCVMLAKPMSTHAAVPSTVTCC